MNRESPTGPHGQQNRPRRLREAAVRPSFLKHIDGHLDLPSPTYATHAAAQLANVRQQPGSVQTIARSSFPARRPLRHDLRIRPLNPSTTSNIAVPPSPLVPISPHIIQCTSSMLAPSKLLLENVWRVTTQRVQVELANMHSMCSRAMSREEQLRAYCLRLKAERDSAREERDKAREKLGTTTVENQVESIDGGSPGSLKRAREEVVVAASDEETTVWISKREGHGERRDSGASSNTLVSDCDAAPPNSGLVGGPSSPSISPLPSIHLPPLFSTDNPATTLLNPPPSPSAGILGLSSSDSGNLVSASSARCSPSPDGGSEDVDTNARTSKRRRMSQEWETSQGEADISDNDWQFVSKESEMPDMADGSGVVKVETEDPELDELMEADDGRDSDSNTTVVDKSSFPTCTSTSRSQSVPHSNISISHIDLLYQATPDKLICRMCLRRRHYNLSLSPPTWFSRNATWSDLTSHCEKEHPTACEDLGKLSPSQVVELRQRLASNSSRPRTGGSVA